MCARITFPATDSRTELKLFYVTSVEIASSWKMLTDTADIVIPRKIKTFSGQDLNTFFSAWRCGKNRAWIQRELCNRIRRVCAECITRNTGETAL